MLCEFNDLGYPTDDILCCSRLSKNHSKRKADDMTTATRTKTRLKLSAGATTRRKYRTDHDIQPQEVQALITRVKKRGTKLEAQHAIVQEPDEGSFRLIRCADDEAVKTLEELDKRKTLKFWCLVTEEQLAS